MLRYEIGTINSSGFRPLFQLLGLFVRFLLPGTFRTLQFYNLLFKLTCGYVKTAVWYVTFTLHLSWFETFLHTQGCTNSEMHIRVEGASLLFPYYIHIHDKIQECWDSRHRKAANLTKKTLLKLSGFYLKVFTLCKMQLVAKSGLGSTSFCHESRFTTKRIRSRTQLRSR